MAQVQHAAINCVAVLLQTSAQAARPTVAATASRPTAAPAITSRSAAVLAAGTCAAAAAEASSSAGTRSKISHTAVAATTTTTADAAAAAAATTAGETLESGAALELSEVKPAKQKTAIGDVTIGDVPGFVASVAVGGVLPECCSGGGGEGGCDWLPAALQEAFRRDAPPEDGEDGSGEVELPAQVRVLDYPFSGSVCCVWRVYVFFIMVCTSMYAQATAVSWALGRRLVAVLRLHGEEALCPWVVKPKTRCHHQHPHQHQQQRQHNRCIVVVPYYLMDVWVV